MLLFLTPNMAAVTSLAKEQYVIHCGFKNEIDILKFPVHSNGLNKLAGSSVPKLSFGL